MKETTGLFIRSKTELEKFLFYYNCQTLEELEKLLYDDYIRTFIETFNPSHQAHQSREDKTKK